MSNPLLPLTDKQLWIISQGCSDETQKLLDEIVRLRAIVAKAVAILADVDALTSYADHNFLGTNLANRIQSFLARQTPNNGMR